MSNYLASVIRTLVPVIVAFVIAQLARAGIDLPAEDLTGVVEVVVLGLYYGGIRFLEENHPKAGWLLGLPAKPDYDKPKT